MNIPRLVGAVCTSLLLIAGPASAVTTFSPGPVVTTADRSASFDSLTSTGIDLTNYFEDGLFVTVNDVTGIDPGFTPFAPLDSRNTAFHYGLAGNQEYVSIRGTGGGRVNVTENGTENGTYNAHNAVFTAVDFLIGDGQTSFSNINTNITWETYLNGTLTGTGNEIGIPVGSVVGWSDVAGFDELRVAAMTTIDNPGFGNFQSIAIDDVRAQIVPIPPAVLLFGSGLLGLVGIARRKKAT